MTLFWDENAIGKRHNMSQLLYTDHLMTVTWKRRAPSQQSFPIRKNVVGVWGIIFHSSLRTVHFSPDWSLVMPWSEDKMTAEYTDKS